MSSLLQTLFEVERLMHLGDLAQLTLRLKTLGLSGSLHTAFVERLNPSTLLRASLTLRHALAALPKASLVGHRPTLGRITDPARELARVLSFLSPALVLAAHAGDAATAAGQADPTPHEARAAHARDACTCAALGAWSAVLYTGVCSIGLG